MSVRLVPVVSAVVIAALMIAIAALVMTYRASSGTDDVQLQGIKIGALDPIRILRSHDSGSPQISADHAVDVATQQKSGAAVVETVLVRLVNETAKPRLDRLAWAVNFDPGTIDAAPPLGLPAGTQVRTCGSHPLFHVAFVDARTGDIILEFQQAVLDESALVQDCPAEPSYPPPTNVPGQG